MASSASVLALDVEHTGFLRDGGSEEVVQVGLVWEDGRAWSRYFLPEGESTTSALETHGLSREYLVERVAGPFDKEAAEEIKHLLADAKKVVGHNLEHDLGVLFKAFKKVGAFLDLGGVERVCTLKTAQQYDWPG